MVVSLYNIALNTCIAFKTSCFDGLIYGILMQNGEHITVLDNYLKSIAVITIGYRMAATFLRKKCYMNQIVKCIFMLLLSYFVSYK